jgi:hypothetical protein
MLSIYWFQGTERLLIDLGAMLFAYLGYKLYIKGVGSMRTTSVTTYKTRKDASCAHDRAPEKAVP